MSAVHNNTVKGFITDILKYTVCLHNVCSNGVNLLHNRTIYSEQKQNTTPAPVSWVSILVRIKLKKKIAENQL